MDAQKIEDAILEEITNLSIPALLFPEKPDGYFPRTSPGEVLIRYTGCKYTRRDIASVTLEKIITNELLYVTRSVRGENGLYEWLDKITEKLEGYSPPSIAGHFEFTEEGFTDYNDGTWYYAQNMIFKITADNEQTDLYTTPIIGT